MGLTKPAAIIIPITIPIRINQVEIKEALDDSIDKIVKSITQVFEQTPPELSGDINDKGLILTGGGSLLTGLNEILEEKLNIPILIPNSPFTCVVEGTGVVFDKPKLLRDNH